MSHKENLPELRNWLLPETPEHRQLLQSVASQISKDLQPHAELDEEPGSLDSLVEQLTKTISQLLNRQPDVLSQVLYRVDLPERMVGEVLAQWGRDENAARHLAVLVIRRALSKVLLRKKFS